MGSPARAYFCSNGHLLASYGHHEVSFIDDDDEEYPIPCPVCGCDKVDSQWEWGDDDYNQLVPVEAIGFDDEERVDHYGNKYFIKVDKYDVSRLFE